MTNRTKARLDADRTAKGKTRLVARLKRSDGKVQGRTIPLASEYVAEDGARVELEYKLDGLAEATRGLPGVEISVVEEILCEDGSRMQVRHKGPHFAEAAAWARAWKEGLPSQAFMTLALDDALSRASEEGNRKGFKAGFLADARDRSESHDRGCAATLAAVVKVLRAHADKAFGTDWAHGVADAADWLESDEGRKAVEEAGDV